MYALTYKGLAWVIGGEVVVNGSTQYTNDVWQTRPDNSGAYWVKVATAQFSPRKQHTVVEFQNKLWLIGGRNSSDSFAEIWSSSDGITWTKSVGTVPFGKRYNHISFVYNNKIWLIGGVTYPETPVNDVWCSSNGVNWVKVADHTQFKANGFLPNGGYDSVVFLDRMWIIGNAFGDKRQVWQSVDGVSWYLAPNDNFTNTTNFTLEIYNGSIWLLSSNGEFDVWHSVNITPTPTP